ncbi:MmpS family transport accessory protein [Micromonospora schwarzwaldensis]|uniref:MmpS family transport accessory protein n=1 Tax=Micromonospora sp. DSM 45708 TaxID=3111767 RepID=UPI0031DA0ED2
MSETPATPEPASGPSDPTAPPAAGEHGSWTPPDPLAAPQPWTPPSPWSPLAWEPSPWASPDPPAAPAPLHPGSPHGSPPDGPAATPSGGPGGPNHPGGPNDPSNPNGPNHPHGPKHPGHPDHPNHPGASGQPPTAYPPGPYPPAAHPPGSYPPAAYPPAAYPPGPYPPPYAYPGGAPRRSNAGWAIGLVITLVVALVLAVCGCVGLGALGGLTDRRSGSGEPYERPFIDGPAEPDGFADEPTPAPDVPVTTPSGGPGRFTVVYEVTGTGRIPVQFYDADATFHQIDVKAPWRLRFTANDRQRVQVIVANSTSVGEVSCRITIDGTVVSRRSGEWGVACFGW